MDSVFFIDTGDLVNLVAHTRHGKNRLNQHGNPWTIKHLRKGRMLLESSGPTDKGGEFNFRWVDLHNDADFTWSKA